MSHVLIWKNVYPGSKYDIFNPTDYSGIYEHSLAKWNGCWQNWGNKLWFQGVYSAINTGENTYDFISGEVDIDTVNSKYDFIFLPMANIFHTEFLGDMRHLTEIFSRVRIPVYVVVCGVQADSYDDLPRLIDEIGNDSRAFIRTIYNTGGDFALRGYFTEEFFRRLGFYDATVTGCPSLFQKGRSFRVEQPAISVDKMRPTFNGSVKMFENLMDAYHDSVFIDQSQYFLPLYQPDYLENAGLKFQMAFVDNYGYTAAHLLSQGRIAMIADMNAWYQYLRNSGFHYAFGSRIHGTIMALLSGVPATIITTDSRTREMAEFFDIPLTVAEPNHRFTMDEFHRLYEQVDYSKFNRTFPEKFDAYEQFLVKHGIVSHVNADNPFFDVPANHAYLDFMERGKEPFAEFAEKLDRNRTWIELGNLAKRVKRKVF